MPSNLESDTSPSSPHPPRSGWLKVGVVAAATAIAGGLAAAWYYRKTLDRLRQAEDASLHSHFGNPDEENNEDA